MIRFLDLHHLHAPIADELRAVFDEVLQESAFIGGRRVSEFEAAFASFVGAKHCVGVANGTDAIEIALEALGVAPGDEVIVPANSFIATSEAVTRAGATVVFADIDPETMNIDIDDVRSLINSRTVGIVAVHLYGNPADLDGLCALRDEHGLFLIEDCAQAHGATLHGRHVGTFGDIATFSFYPGKNLGALGDGGAIVTKNDDLASKSRMIANHGRISKYDHLFEGRNSRLDGLQAALLSVKLPHLKTWVAARRSIADQYDEGLRDAPVSVLRRHPSGEHAFHLYVVRTSARQDLMEHLTGAGIECGIHYPIALPELAAYQAHPQHGRQFIAGPVAKELLSLPMGSHLTAADVSSVIDAIQNFVADHR